MKALPLLLLLLSLGVGFALGWLVFSRGEAPPETTTRAPRGGSPAPEQETPPTPAENPEPRRIDLAETIRNGALENLWPIVNDRERTWSDAEVAALVVRIDHAIAEKKADEFQAALRGLAQARTAAAQRKLLELMMDESLSFPHRMGRAFLEGLGDSDLPGVATAARRRFDRNVESGKTSWVAGDGYFDLIARRGSDADIEWLSSRAESGQIRHHSRRALARSDNPAAVRFVVRLIESGKGDQDLLLDFARRDNADAAPLLQRVILGEVPAAYRDLSTLLGAYGGCVSEENLEAARDFLLSLRTPIQQVSAVYAVESLRGRGLSIAGFETIVDAPVEFLERLTTESDRSITSKARYAIGYNRVAWSSRAAAALEFASGIAGQGSMSKDMLEIAAKVRAGLANRWR
jgi:hypothetical protein